jgi:hypothetical protein
VPGFTAGVVWQDALAMTSVSHPELLRLPVTVNGIEVGRTVEALVDASGEPIGFELACRDGTRRFLPAGAAVIGPHEIRVGSALVFLGERELEWYRERASAA